MESESDRTSLVTLSIPSGASSKVVKAIIEAEADIQDGLRHLSNSRIGGKPPPPIFSSEFYDGGARDLFHMSGSLSGDTTTSYESGVAILGVEQIKFAALDQEVNRHIIELADLIDISIQQIRYAGGDFNSKLMSREYNLYPRLSATQEYEVLTLLYMCHSGFRAAYCIVVDASAAVASKLGTLANDINPDV
ncbi:hypothetical protein [Nocardia sp. NPDC050793]|uniref:hypothetical protein n=1 Tax=Nocardia sp. NPDC050793 TaxID=3155159 RepID=UPI0033DB8CEA